MGKRLTQEEFIIKCKNIHGDKYDYSETQYIDNKTKITIICLEHGEFLQLSGNHLAGRGCFKCGNINSLSHQKLTTKQFIEKANKIHNNKFDYSKTIYKGNNENIIIICKKHQKEFIQIARSHLQYGGCLDCRVNNIRLNQGKTNKEFIIESNLIHNFRYDYSKVNYINKKTHVEIICLNHGSFLQLPYTHLRGQGCKKCFDPHWSNTDWENKGKNSNHFDSFKVYIIKCWNEDENFYKIGKTFNSINERYKSKLPYKFEIIKIIESLEDGIKISKLEKELHILHKEFYYKPQIYFPGFRECFSKLLNIEYIIKK